MRIKVAVYSFRSELLFRLFGMGILLLGMLAIAVTTASGQTVYYYGPQPIVVQPHPAVVGQGPIIVQVIDPPAPPPAVVRVVPPPTPASVVPSVAPVPAPAGTSVTVNGGVSNVCVSCSNVTQTINTAKTKAGRAGGVSKAPAPTRPSAPGNTPPTAGSTGRDDWWLFPLLLALLGGLFLVLLGWLFGRSRQPRPGSPAPPPLPVAPSTPPVAAPVAPVAVSAPVGPSAVDPGMVTIPIVMRIEADPIVIGMNPAVRRPRVPPPAQAPTPAASRVRVGSGAARR